MYSATFWTNPQYRVSIVDPDSDDDDGNGSVIIGLMQKNRRKMRREGKNEMTIGYAVYEVCCSSLRVVQVFIGDLKVLAEHQRGRLNQTIPLQQSDCLCARRFLENCATVIFKITWANLG